MNKPKCKHEPKKIEVSGIERFGKAEISMSTLEALLAKTRKCKHCGCQLVAKWEPES